MQTTTETKPSAGGVLIALIRVIEETVKSEPKGVPSGLIYSALMTKGVSLTTYETIINALKKAGKITEKYNLLFWNY